MKRLLCVLLLLGWTAGARAADEVPLVADLSNHLVAITTGFSGTDVLLFGATNGPGDIAIVVRGPVRDEVVRRKGRLGPIWANAASMTFHDIPSYYRVASSRPLEEFATPAQLARYQIGVDAIRMVDDSDTSPSPEAVDFRKALLRLKSDDNLYDESLGGVALMSNRLFRTELHFPANVPTGPYSVEVYLFREGQIVGAEIVPLNISKIGVGADIFDFANGRFAFVYGLLSVLTAGSAGWAASAVFRRV